MADQPCGGTEFGADSVTGAMVVRQPRPLAWPAGLGAQQAGNGLLTDAAQGLWTPQGAAWPVRQDQSGQPNAWPGRGSDPNPWIAPNGAGPLSWQPITNPSASSTAVVELNIEWEISCQVWQNMWEELQGSFNFPGVGAVPGSSTPVQLVEDGIADFCPPGYSQFHETVTRTVAFTLAPGGSTTPQVGWKLVNTAGPGWIPGLSFWRVSLIGNGWVRWPSSVPVA
jgi:hypothetical protein